MFIDIMQSVIFGAIFASVTIGLIYLMAKNRAVLIGVLSLVALLICGTVGYGALADNVDIVYVKGDIIAVSIDNSDLVVEVETEDGDVFSYYAEGGVDTVNPVVLKIWVPEQEVVDVTNYVDVLLPRHLDVFEDMPRCWASQKTMHIEGISPFLCSLTVTFGR